MARKIAAGNWKMNGTSAELSEIQALLDATKGHSAEIIICPPATLLSRMAAVADGHALQLGGQDIHAMESGAHTGDVSGAMLADAGATVVIVGHSERRTDHGETNLVVQDKAKAAWNAGLRAIICVGETLEERDAGNAAAVVVEQLDGSVPDGANARNCVIAYEPVWAIGTGRVADNKDIAEMHATIRDTLRTRFGADIAEEMSILYGGSVKPTNAKDIFAIPNVDGGLVGGASLKASDFAAIVAAAS